MKLVLICFLISGLVGPSYSFQTEPLPSSGDNVSRGLNLFQKLEAGIIQSSDSKALFELFRGDYSKALLAVTPNEALRYPWLKPYLTELIDSSGKLIRFESDHFILYVPQSQTFLRRDALSALEKSYDHHKKVFGLTPKNKIIVEIYPTKESFSSASTLDMETLKRSGAIGICKFHRLMILTPKGLPLGYRWLDALSHEYTHLLINELTWSKAELWLHEGTAKYFDTAWRVSPPAYLSPNQKTKLLQAKEEGKLISFESMSPSLVYLENQDEVSLAFGQVSHAIGQLVSRHGRKKYQKFLKHMRKNSFKEAFAKIYSLTPVEFENQWRVWLGAEEWEKTKGTMSDDIVFDRFDENKTIGASVKGKVRLGDKMRVRGHFEGAQIQYEKALSEEPDNATILLKSARVHLVLKEEDKAKLKLERAIIGNPNYGTPYIELAKLIKGKEGEKYLIEANAINPFNPEIHALLLDFYISENDKQQATHQRQVLEELFRKP